MDIFAYCFSKSYRGPTGSFFLIELLVHPRLSLLTNLQRWLLAGLSTLTGVFLLLAGTTAWKSPERFLAFLLPNEKLEISVPASRNLPNADIAIQLLSTSMGDISFNSIHYQGWQRKGNLLVLSNLKNNSLEWTGKAGEQITIVFHNTTPEAIAQISTDGSEETINFSSEVEKEYFYTHRFPVPIYASRTIVILLGALDFSAICFVIGLFIFEKRKVIERYFQQSFLMLPIQRKGAGEKSSEKDLRIKTTTLDWAIVLGTIALAVLLRVFNLNVLPPFTDEYIHLLAGKAIASGAPLNSVYPRSLFVVTLPVALFFKIFGLQLWAARLPGVIVSVLAIIPLYLISKRINRLVALLSCILYATNPWLIAMSRYGREYGYYPFYFYWIIYGMIIFLELFPDNFLVDGWKKIFRSDIILLAGALFLPIIYAVFIATPDESFKLIAIAYGVLTLFILSKLTLRPVVVIELLAILAILILGALYFFNTKSGNISFHPMNSYWLRYFFPNPQQQWYFDRPAIVPMIGFVCAIFLGVYVRKFNFIPFFFVALFSVSLFFYLFLVSRYIQARYIFNVDFWFIPLLAIGFWCIWAFLQAIFSNKRILASLIWLILLASSMNLSQILLPTFYDNYGWMPITEENHDDVKLTQAFLLDKVKPGQALISTDYAKYVTFEGNSSFDAIYAYNYIKDNNYEEYFSSIIKQQNSGWIVLDDQVYKAFKPFPLKTTFVDKKEIEYMGKVANEYIWQWGATNG